MVILTIDYNYSKDSENETIAADFYDYNDFGMNFFETSAKSNQNVNETFTFLTREILKGCENKTTTGGVELKNQKKDKNKSGCCGGEKK